MKSIIMTFPDVVLEHIDATIGGHGKLHANREHAVMSILVEHFRKQDNPLSLTNRISDLHERLARAIQKQLDYKMQTADEEADDTITTVLDGLEASISLLERARWRG